MVLEIVLYVLVFITAIPAGLLLAWLCDDELIYPRRYFKTMIFILLMGVVGFLVFYRNFSAILSMGYMALVFFVMLWKGRKG
jgi:hypothetical protein